MAIQRSISSRNSSRFLRGRDSPLVTRPEKAIAIFYTLGYHTMFFVNFECSDSLTISWIRTYLREQTATSWLGEIETGSFGTVMMFWGSLFGWHCLSRSFESFLWKRLAIIFRPRKLLTVGNSDFKAIRIINIRQCRQLWQYSKGDGWSVCLLVYG